MTRPLRKLGNTFLVRNLNTIIGISVPKSSNKVKYRNVYINKEVYKTNKSDICVTLLVKFLNL